MDGKQKDARYERWLVRATSAYERMFSGKSQEELVTLTEREDMAIALSKELAAFLLEEHVAADPVKAPAEACATCCPKCGQPGTAAPQKVGKGKASLPKRRVTTRAGDIDIQRERWKCTRCRIVFFPLDVRLKLGTEGYSPAILEKGIRQASKACSFVEASEDMRELAEIEISPTHLQRLSERVGEEWEELREEDVEKFRERRLERDYKEPPRGAVAVMLDGGRVQTRAEDAGRGVSDPGWRESKVACCLTIDTKIHAVDPQPEPPVKFLEPTVAARLASEVKRRSRPATERSDAGRRASQASKQKRGRKSKKQRRTRKKCSRLRTVVATMENSEIFGWQVAAEVHRRGLDRAARKGCVCDGQAYNWSIYEMHLLPAGFIAILDFLHLLAYLHDAAYALGGADEARSWKTYKQWLCWAWSGKVGTLLSALREAAATLKAKGSTATARRQTVEETLTYVSNNRQRMNYPEYRCLGLPVSSAPVESTIKQINRRIKGSEKFWLEGGAEAILQLRAAQLSEDDRWKRYWARPRKHRRAAGTGRLAQGV